jgi:hypothetical protein
MTLPSKMGVVKVGSMSWFGVYFVLLVLLFKFRERTEIAMKHPITKGPNMAPNLVPLTKLPKSCPMSPPTKAPAPQVQSKYMISSKIVIFYSGSFHSPNDKITSGENRKGA